MAKKSRERLKFGHFEPPNTRTWGGLSSHRSRKPVSQQHTRMITRTPLAIATAALFIAGISHAQSVNQLQAAVEKAILENPEVKVKHKNLLASANEQAVAEGGWRPRIDLEATAGEKSTFSPGMKSDKGYSNSTATLQLLLPLPRSSSPASATPSLSISYKQLSRKPFLKTPRSK